MRWMTLCCRPKASSRTSATWRQRSRANATAKLKTGEFSASKVSVALTGASGKDNFDVKLDAPNLNFTADKASGDKVTMIAKITSPQGTTGVNLTLPGIEGTAQAFKSGAMTLDLDMKQGDLTVKSKLSSPVSGNLSAQQVSLPKLVAHISASGPNLPGKSLSGELAGSASVDAVKESVQANLAGKIADSNIKAKPGVARFSPPGIHFDIDIDQLDIDRYLPQQTAGAQKKPEQPLDLSALKTLHANGSLKIGALKVANVKATNVRVDIKADGGRVDVSPIAANLYQGTLDGALPCNAAPATPAFAVKQNLNGINIGPLLKDARQFEPLEGQGNVALNVTAQGNTVTAIKKALNGNAAIKLTDGAIKGIDIAGSIRNAKAKLGTLKGEQTQAVEQDRENRFFRACGELQHPERRRAQHRLADEVAAVARGRRGRHRYRRETARLHWSRRRWSRRPAGQGGQDIGRSERRDGAGAPERSADRPIYKIDFGAMAAEAVKQKAEEAVRGQLEKQLGGGAAKEGAKEAPKSNPLGGSRACSGGEQERISRQGRQKCFVPSKT